MKLFKKKFLKKHKRVQWKGTFSKGRDKTPIAFEHLVITPESKVQGFGTDTYGPYKIDGTITKDGKVKFIKTRGKGGNVEFNGKLIENVIKGTWKVNNFLGEFEVTMLCSPFYGTSMYQTMKKDLDWNLSFDKNGAYGVGIDETGLYVIKGEEKSPTNFKITQTYLQINHSMTYRGAVTQRSPTFTINGNWQNNSSTQFTGTFHVTTNVPVSPVLSPDLLKPTKGTSGNMLQQQSQWGQQPQQFQQRNQPHQHSQMPGFNPLGAPQQNPLGSYMPPSGQPGFRQNQPPVNNGNMHQQSSFPGQMNFHKQNNPQTAPPNQMNFQKNNPPQNVNPQQGFTPQINNQQPNPQQSFMPPINNQPNPQQGYLPPQNPPINNQPAPQQSYMPPQQQKPAPQQNVMPPQQQHPNPLQSYMPPQNQQPQNPQMGNMPPQQQQGFTPPQNQQQKPNPQQSYMPPQNQQPQNPQQSFMPPQQQPNPQMSYMPPQQQQQNFKPPQQQQPQQNFTPPQNQQQQPNPQMSYMPPQQQMNFQKQPAPVVNTQPQQSYMPPQNNQQQQQQYFFQNPNPQQNFVPPQNLQNNQNTSQKPEVYESTFVPTNDQNFEFVDKSNPFANMEEDDFFGGNDGHTTTF